MSGAEDDNGTGSAWKLTLGHEGTVAPGWRCRQPAGFRRTTDSGHGGKCAGDLNVAPLLRLLLRLYQDVDIHLVVVGH